MARSFLCPNKVYHHRMTTDSPASSGVTMIKALLPTLPERPGVYRMIGADGTVLYVGKAKALKKRVTSYTQPERQSGRIQRMVALAARMEFIETHTEAEALLLEANMIKALRPPYNILLKDDKMFPYLFIPAGHDFPRVMKFRGARKDDGTYYGPFLSGTAVNDAINALHRIFQIRNCTDGYFAARKRPCLQYHIKRCTAPCVGKVSPADYARQIDGAKSFLAGNSRAIQDDYTARMQAASSAHDFETAAVYRDKIRLLAGLMTKQNINLHGLRDADVIALTKDQGGACIQVFFFRAGQNYGNQSYFPDHTEDLPPATIMAAFLGQFYADKTPPDDVIISHDPDDRDLIDQILSTKAGRKIDLGVPIRGVRREILSFALNNADEALARHRAARASSAVLITGLQTLFNLEHPPGRIEVYDNSHLGGTGQIGAMIVATPDGFRKTAYRKFNIKTAGASDDYAMMREVMTRRFSRALAENQGPGSDSWPDLVLIDGGMGQLTAVYETLTELGVWDDLNVVAIAKGPDRNAGREVLHQVGRDPFQLPPNDPVLHYLQRLRDEAHRFAIGSQRARRQPGLTQSILDQIPGIGAKRKKSLLLHFGSAKGVADAALADLEKVEGISKAFAKKLYDYFRQ